MLAEFNAEPENDNFFTILIGVGILIILAATL